MVVPIFWSFEIKFCNNAWIMPSICEQFIFIKVFPSGSIINCAVRVEVYFFNF